MPSSRNGTAREQKRADGNRIIEDAMTSRIADMREAEARGFARGIEAAAKIVSQARFGEIDNDLRSIIYAIRALQDSKPYDH